MKNLNRKKFEIIFFAIITSVAMFSITTTNGYKQDNTMQEVSVTPTSEKVVILDAGHGRRRWGCCFK